MITPSQVYWITRCDALHGFASALMAVGIIATVFGTFIGPAAFSELGLDYEAHKKSIRLIVGTILSCLTLSCLLLVFIPTTKEMAAIIVLPAVANNEDVQALGSELPKLAREWLEQLRPKQDAK